MEALEPFLGDWNDAGVPASIDGKRAMISVDLECSGLTVGDWRGLMEALTAFRSTLGEGQGDA
jgi:hypothetical protein